MCVYEETDTAARDTILLAVGVTSRLKLSEWGALGAKILEKKFEIDNVHLTMGQASFDGPAAQVIKSLNRS